jgi:predicted NUDIX family phosphoesterase
MFLKAAYEVLKASNAPLTAREITEEAKRLNLLNSSGLTPFQTMKSKLSTNILQHGEHSIFMRAGKGRFALREWKTSYPEHIADRYQKALFDEDIVVFPAESLRKYIPQNGLFMGNFDHWALFSECRPMRRRHAEEDFSVIQLVSVFVVRHNDRILTYKRTKRLPESRLHGQYSVGFGGHLNPEDLRPLLDIFDPIISNPLLERELNEELRFPSSEDVRIGYRGLLYDESREVSRQHLGLTYDVTLSSGQFEVGERGFLIDAKFETIHEITLRKHDFENWSLILIEQEQPWTSQSSPHAWTP